MDREHQQPQKPVNSFGDELLCPLFYQLPPENIVRFKFLVEGYDEFGVVRTINNDAGEVVVLALKDFETQVLELLQSEAENLGLRRIPPPTTLSEDWLLKEYLEALA